MLPPLPVGRRISSSMSVQFQGENRSSEKGLPTLGGLLYRQSRPVVSEQEWLALIRSIAAGDTGSFGNLYMSMHGIVFTLIMRISRNREIAEELTVEVFHEVWRSASAFDPAHGTVVGWIANLAHAKAVARMRSNGTGDLNGGTAPNVNGSLRNGIRNLTTDERSAIEGAFVSGLNYREVSARDGRPTGTVKARIRSGLDKLRALLVHATRAR